MILAIDTATRMASIALYDATGVLAEETWRSRNNHSVELMPAVTRLVERQQKALSDISGVAVSLGPGSFTGLRIGLSLAKGLCLALQVPLIGVPTLQVTAYAAGDPGCPILAIAEAGRGRICVGKFAYSDGLPEMQGDITLHRATEWSPDLADYVLITGEIDPALADRLATIPDAESVQKITRGAVRRASFLAELAGR